MAPTLVRLPSTCKDKTHSDEQGIDWKRNYDRRRGAGVLLKKKRMACPPGKIERKERYVRFRYNMNMRQ